MSSRSSRRRTIQDNASTEPGDQLSQPVTVEGPPPSSTGEDMEEDDDVEGGEDDEMLEDGETGDVEEEDDGDEEDDGESDDQESHLSPQETAASQCRLPPKEMSPDELRIFSDLEKGTSAMKDVYVYARNTACLMWIEEPQSQLVLEKLLETVSDRDEWLVLLEDAGLLPSSYQDPDRKPGPGPPKLSSSGTKTVKRIGEQCLTFLERYGIVNTGRFAVYRPALTSPLSKQFKVVVIGAGIAGLMAARQLQYFGCQVTLLESRDRIGGRIWTFRHGDFVADLGAMVVTGLSGNPVSILSKQMPVELAPIKTNCPLYSTTGSLIGKEKDEPVEEEFNRLLTTAAHLCHKKGMHSLDGQALSLGHTIELLIKYQERHARQMKLQHLEIQENLQKNLSCLLDQMAVVRQKIEVAYAEWAKADAEAKRLRTYKGNGDQTDPNVETSYSSDGSSTLLQEGIRRTRETIVVEGSAEFEARRLLRELSKRWAELEPLYAEHKDIIKKLDLMKENEPYDCYLTAPDRQLLDWHLANLEFANASQLDQLSLMHWDQDDQFEFPGEHMVVANGYGSLPQGLAESLHVQLKTSVKNIRYNNEGVTVEAVNAALSEDDVVSYKADAVICTLPLGVLKESLNNPHGTNSPQFDPPLPSWKTDAIKRLGYGVLNKVVLCFERFFWDRQISLFGHLNESTGDRGEFFLFWSLYDRPVLIALIAGRAAVEYERECFTKEEIVARALVVLRGIFSNNVPQPVGSYVTRWQSDVDSRGSYSYVAVGSTGEDYDLLGHPVSLDGGPPRLFFAGEHTNRRYPATVHGALLSGLAQSAQIANHFFPGEYAPSVPTAVLGVAPTLPPTAASSV